MIETPARPSSVDATERVDHQSRPAWTTRQLRHVTDLIVSNVDKLTAEGELPVRLCNYVDVYKNERITDRLSFMTATATPDEVQRFRLRRGDVVITKDSESWTDIAVPTLVEYEAPDLVCGYHLAILRTDPAVLDGAFLLRALQSKDAQAQFHARATGITRYGLAQPDIKSVRIPVPPLDEQRLIARYLDHHGGKVNAFIRAKRRLIDLLNEQRQAAIHQAVTRGLDPTVPLKPSGIDWLGDIPAHWRVCRSRYLFSEVDDRSKSGQEAHLSMSQKRGLVLSSEIQEHRLVSETYIGAKVVQPQDLVLNRLKAHLGVFALSSHHGLVSPDYTVLRPRVPLSGQFYEAVYRTPACRVELRRRIKGIVEGLWRLYTDDFGSISVPEPPFDEQVAIMGELSVSLAALDSTLARTNRSIELVREHQTRLIAEVVSGKLDVRQAATDLPFEIDDANDPAVVEEIVLVDEEIADDVEV